MPSSSLGLLSYGGSSVVQHNLMQRIQKLWIDINLLNYSEIARIKNRIRENKIKINQLMRDNLFELDVNAHEQRQLLKVNRVNKKVRQLVKTSKDQKKIKELQSRIRTEIDRQIELNTWGFHNHIISYKIKVRMTEDIIDLAQKVKLKPEQHQKRELEIMKMLRDQTYDDLVYFVKEREKHPWRVWDKNGYFYKPEVTPATLSLN